MKSAALLLLLALAAAQTQSLPPISYVCPMTGDEDVIEDKPGRCRKCGMELKPIRLDSVWTCPVHSVIAEPKPGKCRIDGRDLVQVTVAVSWTCPGTAIDADSPGTCKDGSPMVKKFTPRAHGNHNPQHGGLFFMAPDNWHHLEGTYPRAGIFRMYLYDDFTKPLPAAQMRTVSGRVVTKDGKASPLVRASNGRYLEARIGTVPLPAVLAAKLAFKPDGPEHHFDFTFPEYSREPAAGVVMTSNAPAPMRMPAPEPVPMPFPAPPADPAAVANAAPAGGVDPGLIPLPIPETVPEMLAQLSQRTDQIRRFIDQGAFANIYVPAFQAKDLALALDEHKKDLPDEHRRIADPAIKRLVRAAWLLDAFGDIGNKDQITQAYAQFSAAVKDVESVFPAKP